MAGLNILMIAQAVIRKFMELDSVTFSKPVIHYMHNCQDYYQLVCWALSRPQWDTSKEKHINGLVDLHKRRFWSMQNVDSL